MHVDPPLAQGDSGGPLTVGQPGRPRLLAGVISGYNAQVTTQGVVDADASLYSTHVRQLVS